MLSEMECYSTTVNYLEIDIDGAIQRVVAVPGRSRQRGGELQELGRAKGRVRRDLGQVQVYEPAHLLQPRRLVTGAATEECGQEPEHQAHVVQAGRSGRRRDKQVVKRRVVQLAADHGDEPLLARVGQPQRRGDPQDAEKALAGDGAPVKSSHDGDRRLQHLLLFLGARADNAALEVVEEEPGDDAVVGAPDHERRGDALDRGRAERHEVLEPPGAADARPAQAEAAALGVAREPERRALRRGARGRGVPCRRRGYGHLGHQRGHGRVERACGVREREEALALLHGVHDGVPRPVRHLLERLLRHPHQARRGRGRGLGCVRRRHVQKLRRAPQHARVGRGHRRAAPAVSVAEPRDDLEHLGSTGESVQSHPRMPPRRRCAGGHQPPDPTAEARKNVLQFYIQKRNSNSEQEASAH